MIRIINLKSANQGLVIGEKTDTSAAKIYRLNTAKNKKAHGRAITIGSFDGIHNGHQFLIKSLCSIAKARELDPCILTFEPHPKEYFQSLTRSKHNVREKCRDTGESFPESVLRLTGLREKIDVLKNLGLSECILMPFGKKLAAVSAEDFVKKVLIDKLNTRYLLVGKDFRFGTKGVGDVSLLAKLSKVYGYELVIAENVLEKGERISSSAVRSALREGDLVQANVLLGYQYFICGRVTSGQRLARTLGFPTANINLYKKSVPLIHGVYLTRISIKGINNLDEVNADVTLNPSTRVSQNHSVVPASYYYGVANVGYRPTVEGKTLRLEVYLFNFSEDLYGRRIKVEFLQYIRKEQKFDGIEALKNQIEIDVRYAQDYLSKQNLI